MRFTKAGTAAVAALCAAVVMCGVALWIIESRLVAAHPECVGAGSPRLSVSERVGDEPVLHRALDRVLSGLGCVPGLPRDAVAK
ncbi:hypothetical protein [Tsukamurella paurometabola]|uniref:Uncharacterized protein n=1 Tax=Tsukamurella paurometabola TaxID=2061 RepID=A0A3P8KCB9_TSUPA|nr:hypothetical protein [Tsukamurella paurometabola]UEA84643.1 hypothetical protein LK411_07445 [Tsukamurella paurometabola]VDR37218.1 Uncharacterised protein [Tsukamurella paurometabola]